MAWSTRSIVVGVAVVVVLVLLLLAWDFLVINLIKSGTVERP